MNTLLTFLKEKTSWDRTAASEDEIPNPACACNYIINHKLVSGFHENTDPVTVRSYC